MRRVLVLRPPSPLDRVDLVRSRGTIVSNVADGILTVNGTTEGDDVTVRCEGGHGVGDDSLSGESGNDELSGGRGDDTCRRGPGADSFVSC